MLIEPEALLMFARRYGLILWRHGGTLCITHETGIPQVWADIIKQNKAALLPLLPDGPATPPWEPATAKARPRGENLDMFGPVPIPAGRADKPKKPKQADPLASPFFTPEISGAEERHPEAAGDGHNPQPTLSR